MSKRYIVILLSLILMSCASNGTGTIGNGQIDIDLGDGKLFGNEKAAIALKTAAQIAVDKDPSSLFKIKDVISDAKAKTQKLTDLYPEDSAVEIASKALMEACGIPCLTAAGQAYIQPIIENLADMSDELSAGFSYSAPQVLDALLNQVEEVEKFNAA